MAKCKKYDYDWCLTKDDVLEKLNRWAKNGWDVQNFFVRIFSQGEDDYTIFYDTHLDEKAPSKSNSID